MEIGWQKGFIAFRRFSKEKQVKYVAVIKKQ